MDAISTISAMEMRPAITFFDHTLQYRTLPYPTLLYAMLPTLLYPARPHSTHAQNIESYLDGQDFYDFGFGNKTGYYDVTKINDGVPCSGPEESGGLPWQDVEDGRDPADVCYTGTYATDAFVGRARTVRFFFCSRVFFRFT